ncbi:hypothetical protein MferCBS31731_000286 [Microsporum ferrugineum]
MPFYLITGASRGLGYAWLEFLSRRPDNIVFGLVRDADATKKRLEASGITNVHIVRADITDFKALSLAADQVASITGGALDVLIANATDNCKRSVWKTVVDLPPNELEDDLMETFKVNVVGLAHTVNAFLPLIRKGAQKKVVAISTFFADLEATNRFAFNNATPYAVSKTAANLLVAKFHAEAGVKEGILFMSISPGVVATQVAPPTPEAVKGRQSMTTRILEMAPHFKGAVSPEESVRQQLDVIDKATVEAFGGAFVSQFGNRTWL